MFFIFTPKIGEEFQFDSYFSDGLKPPTSKACDPHTYDISGNSTRWYWTMINFDRMEMVMQSTVQVSNYTPWKWDSYGK